MRPTYFYNLRSAGLWWARIWVTSDGLITIASDYGYFGYWFGDPGGEIRRFLTRCDPSSTGYMAIKLSAGERVYDAAESVRRIHAEILRLRRGKELNSSDARELWEFVDTYELGDNEHQVRDWLDEDLVREHLGEEAYHFLARTLPGDVRGFMRDVWPAFVEALKAELQSERQHREAFGEMQEMGT